MKLLKLLKLFPLFDLFKRPILRGGYLTLALTFFLMSCAAPERKFPEIFWPLPPDEPRIKFVEIYQSNLDVAETGGLTKVLFGEEVIDVLRKPYGVAADKEGRVYVSDIGRVFVFDRKDKRLWFIGAEEGPAALKKPANVAVSQDGRIYISDTGHKKIFVYDKSGKFLTTIGYTTGELENPMGLAIDDKRQRVYAVDSRKHNVRAYTLDGRLLFTIGKFGDNPGEFNTPSHIALDSEGNIYVVETLGFRVQVFDPSGKYMKNFGQIGDAPGTFSRPKGIAIDSEDHVYVVDTAFQNVQIFDKEGKLLLFFGESGFNFGQFSLPAGIAIDDEDRIYVVDTLNHRVQVFQYLGEKWKKEQAEQPIK